ncbi:MAG: hypothetical protein EA367_09370 [Leptolyngbya sp. DLM2.Bin15]|nr:MAG: hypothetical protein EA367_09370 [Leptolyngbya sp. DLM2.Bin15]
MREAIAPRVRIGRGCIGGVENDDGLERGSLTTMVRSAEMFHAAILANPPVDVGLPSLGDP